MINLTINSFVAFKELVKKSTREILCNNRNSLARRLAPLLILNANLTNYYVKSLLERIIVGKTAVYASNPE